MSILSAELMKPRKLERHPTIHNPKLENKDVAFFKLKEDNVKQQRLDVCGAFHIINQSALKAKYQGFPSDGAKNEPHKSYITSNIVGLHCILYRESLAARTLPDNLNVGHGCKDYQLQQTESLKIVFVCPAVPGHGNPT